MTNARDELEKRWRSAETSFQTCFCHPKIQIDEKTEKKRVRAHNDKVQFYSSHFRWNGRGVIASTRSPLFRYLWAIFGWVRLNFFFRLDIQPLAKMLSQIFKLTIHIFSDSWFVRTHKISDRLCVSVWYVRVLRSTAFRCCVSIFP